MGGDVIHQGGPVGGAEGFVAGGAAAVIVAASAKVVGETKVSTRGVVAEIAEGAVGGLKFALEGRGEGVVDHAVANSA